MEFLEFLIFKDKSEFNKNVFILKNGDDMDLKLKGIGKFRKFFKFSFYR